MIGRLVHTGQVVIDLVLRVPALPPAGGDVMASSTTLAAGGGFNVMAAAARDGAAVVYTGGHGTGPHGDLARAALAAEGVTTSAPISAVDTGICVVLVDDSGERTFVTGSGAETAVSGSLPQVSAADLLYVSGYSLLVPEKAEQILAVSGGAVLLDPGPLVADIDPDLWSRALARTCVLSTNAREARLLTGRSDLSAAALELGTRLHEGAIVLVRDGAAGCLVARSGAVEVVPGFAVEVVDTNGAGDAHCGVLAAALLRGEDVLEAARRANAAAALAVTKAGPATGPTAAEIDRFLVR